MGIEMAARAIHAGRHLIGFDSSAKAAESAKERNIPTVSGAAELLKSPERPRVIWLSSRRERLLIRWRVSFSA